MHGSKLEDGMLIFMINNEGWILEVKQGGFQLENPTLGAFYFIYRLRSSL